MALGNFGEHLHGKEGQAFMLLFRPHIGNVVCRHGCHCGSIGLVGRLIHDVVQHFNGQCRVHRVRHRQPAALAQSHDGILLVGLIQHPARLDGVLEFPFRNKQFNQGPGARPGLLQPVESDQRLGDFKFQLCTLEIACLLRQASQLLATIKQLVFKPDAFIRRLECTHGIVKGLPGRVKFFNHQFSLQFMSVPVSDDP